MYSDKFGVLYPVALFALEGNRMSAFAALKQRLTDTCAQLELLENESMTGQQFADCMEGNEVRTDTDVTLFDSFKEEE